MLVAFQQRTEPSEHDIYFKQQDNSGLMIGILPTMQHEPTQMLMRVTAVMHSLVPVNLSSTSQAIDLACVHSKNVSS